MPPTFSGTRFRRQRSRFYERSRRSFCQKAKCKEPSGKASPSAVAKTTKSQQISWRSGGRRTNCDPDLTKELSFLFTFPHASNREWQQTIECAPSATCPEDASKKGSRSAPRARPCEAASATLDLSRELPPRGRSRAPP